VDENPSSSPSECKAANTLLLAAPGIIGWLGFGAIEATMAAIGWPPPDGVQRFATVYWNLLPLLAIASAVLAYVAAYRSRKYKTRADTTAIVLVVVINLSFLVFSPIAAVWTSFVAVGRG
jgi:hypothetical protein